MPPSQPILSSRLPSFVCRSCLLKLQKPQRLQPPWLSRNIRTAHGPKKVKLVKGTKHTPHVEPRHDGPVIKHFTETPDGRRIEVPEDDPGDEEFGGIIGSIIGNLDEEIEQAAEALGLTREEYEERLGVTEAHLQEKFGLSPNSNPWEKQDGPDEEEVEEDVAQNPDRKWEITEEDVQEELAARNLEKNPEEALPEEIWTGYEMSDKEFEEKMSEDERRHAAKQDKMAAEMESHMNAFPDVDNLSEEDRLKLRKMLFKSLGKDERLEEEDIRDYPDDEIVDPDDKRLTEDSEDGELLPPISKDLAPEKIKEFLPKLEELYQREPDEEEAGEMFEKLQQAPTESFQPRHSTILLPPVQQPEVARHTLTPSDYTVPLRYPFTSSGHEKKLSALNNALTRAYRNLEQKDVLGDRIQKDTWRAYSLCRSILVQFPDEVPIRVWWLLWEIFERPGETNVGRMEHILRLGQDMQQAGITLQGRQQILFIESIFVSGEKNLALKIWRAAANTLGEHELTFRRYWKLGIQMYSENGQPKKALEALSKFLSQSDSAEDSRVLIPVIRAFLAPETPAGFGKAWSVYCHLKYRLGDLMTMKDYDVTASMFLEANQPARALQIFVDMMSRAKTDRAASIDAVEHENIDLVDIADSKISVMHSEALANLPKEFNNKFFFGKWIKKLIGDGDLSGAKRVLDHMRDRGIRADAKHMNGLIGAWYRSKSAKYQTMADETAWRMIEARTEFARQRDEENLLGGGFVRGVRLSELKAKDQNKSILLVPYATIETFSILIEQYRKRLRHDLLERLFGALRVAKVQPSTFFLNETILTHIKYKKPLIAWKDYLQLTDEQNVQPDFDTFLALWHLERKATDPVTRSAHKGFPVCRALFHQMVKHSIGMNRKAIMPRPLYDSIVMAFGLSEDQAGLAVALRAMRKHFNMYPDEHTARSVILHLTRAGLRNSVGYKPRRLNLNPATRERIRQVTEVLAAFKQQRVEDLQKDGVDFNALDAQNKVEEALAMMTSLLRYVTMASLGGEESLSAAIEEGRIAAIAMGVPDCNPWAQHQELLS